MSSCFIDFLIFSHFQLRYYDTTDDSSYRGVIDLAEVETVQMAKSLPGAPKKAEENSFIEVTDLATLIFMVVFTKLPILAMSAFS